MTGRTPPNTAAGVGPSDDLRPMRSREASCVTVLIPVASGSKLPGVTARLGGVAGANGPPWRLTLQWENGERDDVVWTPGFKHMIGAVDDLFTDGSLAHWTRDPAGLIQARVVFDSTFQE